jgi:sugar phosphate isomerase/epimerase
MYFIREYISIIRLVHFKDYCGKIQFDDEGKEIDTSGFACYSPLGHGIVNLQEILEYLEKSAFNGPVMTELDRGEKMPITAEEAVRINKEFLQNLGYEFNRV